MIEFCPPTSNQHPHGSFACLYITLIIADIIDVQNPYAQKTNRCGRQQHIQSQMTGGQIIGANHSCKSKKDKHKQITQSDITVRLFAYCIFNCCENGSNAQNKIKYFYACTGSAGPCINQQ